MSTVQEFDLNNIQGDILSGLPKKTQIYIFFEIINATKFRQDLNKFIPLITTVSDVLKDRKAIEDHKKRKLPGLIPMTGVNISISHQGFAQLGVDDATLIVDLPNDPIPEDAFSTGQKEDAINILGDPKNANGDPDWEDVFLQNSIHGLILISGDSHLSIQKKANEIEAIFDVHSTQASLRVLTSIVGDVRPGDQAGHEHFGFLDGISNPLVKGFDDANTNPGPIHVNPGVIVTGHTGDVKEREEWARDGSFLAFRYLFQNVPEFNSFLQKNPVAQDGNGEALSPHDGSELLGARMVGRWKSGAPIDITPFTDNPVLAKDPARNNDFSFAGEGSSPFKCPFAAHVRKANPRDDLESQQEGAVAPHRIMRRGVQFGPELSVHETETGITEHGRGLLFTCYQTSLRNGFQFIQKVWADDPDFPPFRNRDTTAEPGLDPIIGQGPREMSGLDPLHDHVALSMPAFVVPRGGEYFFTPSLKGLETHISVGILDLSFK